MPFEFKFKVHMKIQKPVAEVFEGVYNPKQLSRYFTTAGASAPLDEGTTVWWEFADFPGKFPVRVTKTVKDKSIAFSWGAGDADKIEQSKTAKDVTLPYDTHVEVRFEALGPANTLVTITEGTWHEDDKGLNSSYGNCMGWTQMLCCLKAFLEYNINLRQGAFGN